jgi:F-type H+-transporting ATPase subunit c
MNKTSSKFALLLMVAGLVLMLVPAAPVQAQEAGMAATSGAERSLLTTAGAGKIGVGLVIIGGAAGIGRIGGSAVESIARQPEAAGQISTAMIITAALIEGATLFAAIICMLK